MTYKELYDSAVEKLDRNLITLGEYENMIKPLDDEIMTAEPKWIPVTERLPKVDRGVLVWCPKRKNIYCAYYDDNDVWNIFGAYQELNDDVIAWMPLPKPYEGSDKE